MRSRSLTILASCICAVPLLVGCGDDDDASPSSGGTGGTAGSAGASGSGGTAGSSGSSGSSGSGGTAGTGTSFKVTIENISGMSALPSPLAPGAYGLTSGTNPIFADATKDPGEGLEALAEDGDPGNLVSSLTAKSGVSAGAFNTPAGQSSAGPALPGDSYEFTFQASPGEKLYLATMFVQSNDAFIANKDGIDLFDSGGSPMAKRDVTASFNLWDAGTEKDEAPGVGAMQAPRQPSANSGPAEAVVSKRVEPTRTIPIPAKMVKVTVTESGGAYTVKLDNVSKTGGAMMTPISPAFYATHNDKWSLFKAGSQASTGLEMLAEDGNPGELKTEHGTDANVGEADVAGAAPVPPGMSLSFTVTPTAATPRLSLATMLVQSNDVFIGTQEAGVALLDSTGTPRPAGDVEADLQASLANWDAGTEANEVPGVGATQAPRQGTANTGPADPDNKIRLYADDTNDLDGAALAKFVSVTVKNAGGLTFDVTVDNTSGATAFPAALTPVAWAVHDATASFFTMGMPASAGLESLAEDGSPVALLAGLTGAGIDSKGAEGSGPAAPGLSFTFKVTAKPSHRFLSIASMVANSNDTFLGLGSAGIELVTPGGAARPDADIAKDIAAMLAAYDAGTEQNQGGALGPDMATNSGGTPNVGAADGNGLVRPAMPGVWAYPMPNRTVIVTVEPQ